MGITISFGLARKWGLPNFPLWQVSLFNLLDFVELCSAWLISLFFLFLFGRNKEGQLADAASETLDLYGQLPNAGGETFHEAQQIVCGKNATFVIKSNGDVYSCGEGSNGRLGHGHSDDIGSLQIIAGIYLKCNKLQ